MLTAPETLPLPFLSKITKEDYQRLADWRAGRTAPDHEAWVASFLTRLAPLVE